MILKELNLYKQSFPFDSVPTTPSLILKYLQDTTDFFPKKNTIRTNDKVWFGHFDLNEKYQETIQTLQRRFNRLFDILKNKSKILFVYTSEADVYNEMGNRYNDNYNELCKIEQYIKETYKYEDFTILAIHTNKSYNNTKNILNYTINVPEIYLSDDMSTHNDKTCRMYRKILELLMKRIFQEEKLPLETHVTIVTPCCRQKSIPIIYNSIQFDKIHKWIIVYDTTKDRKYDKLYEGNPKILEVECNDVGISGNSQRNFGMNLVKDGFIYFLDDDNIIHPNFWYIISSLKSDFFYTFNQIRNKEKGTILYGNNIQINRIDTAMFIVHKNHIKKIQWYVDLYNADGYFICDILNQNMNKHIYRNEIGCYYNYL